MNTTTSHHRSRGRIGRRAILFVSAVAVAAGCGSAQLGSDANRIGAVEAARGSDRHLEMQAEEIAGSTAARIRAVSGSDRHLELQAEEIAGSVEAHVQAARGSDRHLELLAGAVASRSNG